MKRFSVAAAFVTLAVVVAASGSLYGQNPRGQTAGKPGTAKHPEAARMGRSDSKTFIHDMAIAGMAEVELGKMASERAADADVKAFGQMMVKDHSKANDELKQVASQLNVQMPMQIDQKHRDLANRLSKLEGAEFDREYINAMVQGHEEVLAKLRTRAGNRLTSTEPTTPGASGTTGGASGTAARGTKPSGTGSEAVGTAGRRQGEHALTEWATKTLPTVQQHLDRAKELQQKIAK